MRGGGRSPHPLRIEQLAVGPRPPQPPLGAPGWRHVGMGGCLGAACVNWVLAHFQKIAQGKPGPALLRSVFHCWVSDNTVSLVLPASARFLVKHGYSVVLYLSLLRRQRGTGCTVQG